MRTKVGSGILPWKVGRETVIRLNWSMVCHLVQRVKFMLSSGTTQSTATSTFVVWLSATFHGIFRGVGVEEIIFYCRTPHNFPGRIFDLGSRCFADDIGTEGLSADRKRTETGQYLATRCCHGSDEYLEADFHICLRTKSNQSKQLDYPKIQQ